MAKQKPRIKANTAVTKPVVAPVVPSAPGFMLNSKARYVLLFVFTCMLYGNTLWNQYAFDDTMVVTDNRYTKYGFGGIGKHLTHDMFEGAFGENPINMVSGGRYRPLSLVSFSIEYGLMRIIRHDKRGEINDKNVILGEDDPYLNPALSHAVNILLFAFIIISLYYFLIQILPPKRETPLYLSLPFIICLLYAAHPIHTEAVANIKGRDELMCMLFSLLATIAAVKYVFTGNTKYIYAGMAVYFLALLSKENAVTFFAVIPLTFFFFTKAKTKQYLFISGAYAVPIVVFLILRSSFIHGGIGEDAVDILNNPFKLATGTEKFATTVFSYLYYFKLLLLPHPLSHDYYYNQIPYVDAGNLWFIFSVLVNTGLLALAVITFSKRSIISYAILFYFITFSLASNLFFTVGVLLNERFIFIPSLGFCMAASWLLLHYVKNTRIVAGILTVVLSLYSIKTFARNADWKNNRVLFTNDLRWSPNSVRLQTVLGVVLSSAAEQAQDSVEKNRLLDSAIVHLRKSVEIFPPNAKGWLLLGNALSQRSQNPKDVIPIYENAAKYFLNGNYEAWAHLGKAYNDNNEPMKAKDALLKAINTMPRGNYGPLFLLSRVYAKLNQVDSAELWFRMGSNIQPAVAPDYYYIGLAFANNAHNYAKAIEYFEKAIALDPQTALFYENLGEIYGIAGNYDEAIKTTLKLIELNPGSAIGYHNLAVLYNLKGNKQATAFYQEKYAQLSAQNK